MLLLTWLLAGGLSQMIQAQTDEAEPTGKLVVVPGIISLGDTAEVVAFDVEPSDLQVSFEYSHHFAVEGEPCVDGTTRTTAPGPAPTWIPLTACTVGEGLVRLLEADSGTVIAEASVSVAETAAQQEDGVTGAQQGCGLIYEQPCPPAPSISYTTAPDPPNRTYTITVEWGSRGYNRYSVSGDLGSYSGSSIKRGYNRPCEQSYSVTASGRGDGVDFAPIWGPSATRTVTTPRCPPPPPPPLSLPSVSDRTYDVGETVNRQLPAATGGNPPRTYSVSNLPSGLSFSSSTRRITGSPSTAGSRTVTYEVEDDDGDSDSVTFRITVDGVPTLPSVSDRTYDVGDTVNLLLPAATGGNSPLTYSVSNLPSGLSFNSSTRRITGSPTTPGSRTVTYEVEDDDGDSDSVTFRITVGSVPDTEPSLPTVSDRTYDVGDTVNLLLPAATEGNPPLTYSVSNLPSGLSFSSSTRRITGSPTTEGSRTVTYEVEDDDGDTDSEDFIITVAQDVADTEPSLPSVSNRTYDVGETVNLLLPVATGGNLPRSYSVSNLPSGLSFSTLTRRITGSPTTPGSRTVTYEVEDDDGDSDSVTFQITVDGVPSLPTLSNRTYDVGDTVNFRLPAATGGNPPLTYSVSNLPSGLSFSSSTRRITGSPTTEGSSTVTYEVEDDDGDSDSETFKITITSTDQPGSVTLSPNTPPLLDQSITATLSDPDGGVTGRSWQWQSKTLQTPSGLEWQDILGATSQMYTPVVGDIGDEIRATVTYTDAHGPRKRAVSDATAPVSVSVSEPQGVTTEDMIGGRGIAVKWDPVTDVDGYQARRHPLVGGNPQVGVNPETSGDLLTNAFDATELAPGITYGFEVRAWKRYGSSRFYSSWSNRVDWQAPTPTQLGHQADHTVAYQEGSITSAPGLPSNVPDARTVIRGAISDAVAAWNDAAKTIGKDLKICKVGECNGSNRDRGTITIQTAGETSTGQNNSCTWSTACTKDSPFPRQSEHIAGIDLIFEEPAWECGLFDKNTNTCVGVNLRIFWSHIGSNDRTEAKGLAGNVIGEFRYVDPIMMHEFGHTLGLPDFYLDYMTDLMGLDAVMNDPYSNKTPTDEDIAQLKAIYARHRLTDHYP